MKSTQLQVPKPTLPTPESPRLNIPIHLLEQLTDMPLLHKPKLILIPITVSAPAPLMRIHIPAAQPGAIGPKCRRATPNTRATSRARIGVTSLPKDEAETPSRAHAGTVDGRGPEVGFVGHLGGAEGGCG